MKKLTLLLIILILAFPIGISASEDYITISPYPYSSHVLGDDLVIYGDTSFSHVGIGLYYPDENGYDGQAKLIVTISAKELRNGYTIETGAFSRVWPEGAWKIKAQYGGITTEIRIPMTKEPLYNRQLRIAEYTDNTLTSVVTYSCRGIQYRDNIITIPLSDGSHLRVFSWNNLSPADSGAANLFIATCKDGYVTAVKTFAGELIDYGKHTTLIISPTERLEIFYWSDNLTPIM